MSLVHTLLFIFQKDRALEDMILAANCLKSLESSTYKTVVVYNQGEMKAEALKNFTSAFNLDCRIIGDGVNVGTAAGRQKCFEYIWAEMPETDFISELHLDMIFSPHWEDKLIQYLESHDEPLISCGIVDKQGRLPFLNKTVTMPENYVEYKNFLDGLQTDQIVHGFTNPCIHVSKILKETGGYNTSFLKGRQCFEDDSMLLGYYYYYGTRIGWQPKINYNSVVYHAVAGQRHAVKGSIKINYAGLVTQYGVMGLKALSRLHSSTWHKRYFQDRYNENIASFEKLQQAALSSDVK